MQVTNLTGVMIKVSHHSKIKQDTVVSILFYFVVVTDLNPYSIDTQQDAYDKSLTGIMTVVIMTDSLYSYILHCYI
jgi:hypothetical protein